MACGDGDKKPVPQPPSGPITIGRSPVVVRVPVSQRSPLVSEGAPAYPRGFTGYKETVDVQGIGSRGFPPRGTAAPPDSSRARGTVAEGAGGTLSAPERPRTTAPLPLIERSPADRWRGIHPRALPRETADTSLRFSFSDVAHLMPMDEHAPVRWRDYKMMFKHARIQGKPAVLLVAGPSALQFATAPRIKPGSPGVVLGAGPQEPLRPNALRGRLAVQDRVPRPILERIAVLKSGDPR